MIPRVLLLISVARIAWTETAPVKLERYPQKFTTFYKVDDPKVPAGIRSPSPPAPTGDVTALAIGSDGATWLGTAKGVFRLAAHGPEQDRRHYFAGRRYLLDDDVQQLVADRAGGMWARTRNGVSHIELRPMTLAAKARLFEERVKGRHDRYGMVASSRLREPGKLESNVTVSSDNDGLWTAMYAAGECFRYAVTRSAEALASARKSIEAVLFLEQVTGIPGFPARSYVQKGDPVPSDGSWHWTPDGLYRWKADTSSDEIVGHFFILGIAWDLLPPTDPLRRRVAATARRVMDHILANDLNLVDLHGGPTYWGRWSPAYFTTPRGKPDSPLNALELLSFLRTAHQITGDVKYETEYRRIAVDQKYAELTTRLLELREELNYSDEELAFLPFYLLFQYEKDPKLLDIYRRAMDQWWQNAEREKNPLWTFIYLRGRPTARVDLEGAVRTLYRTPMDLRNWACANSHRKDVQLTGEEDRFGRRQSLTLLPPDERPVMKWNGNPFVIDGGGDGSSEDDGGFFLLPYWMGRYHKYLLGE